MTGLFITQRLAVSPAKTMSFKSLLEVTLGREGLLNDSLAVWNKYRTILMLVSLVMGVATGNCNEGRGCPN